MKTSLMDKEAVFRGEKSRFLVEVVINMWKITLLGEAQKGLVRTEWELVSMTGKVTVKGSGKVGEG